MGLEYFTNMKAANIDVEVLPMCWCLPAGPLQTWLGHNAEVNAGAIH